MKPWKTRRTRRRCRRAARFNGATAMKPWKTYSRQGCAGEPQRLQWGHGDEAVEDRTWPGSGARRTTRLQWGHGDEAVEDWRSTRGASSRAGRFNGATAMKPWKTAAAWAGIPE